MNLAPDKIADLLMKAIVEDRSELRHISERIYTTTSTVVVSSFAVTSFLLGAHGVSTNVSTSFKWQFFVLIDVAFLLMLWLLFMRLFVDLNNVQLYVEAREDLLRKIILGEAGESEEVTVFRSVPSGFRRKIRHDSMYWVVGAGTIAILVKIIAVILVV
jgi:hypothetical protein